MDWMIIMISLLILSLFLYLLTVRYGKIDFYFDTFLWVVFLAIIPVVNLILCFIFIAELSLIFKVEDKINKLVKYGRK